MNRQLLLAASPFQRVASAAVLALALGCDRDPMVRVYDVEPATPPSGQTAGPAAGGSATDQAEAKPKRMLAAVIPFESSAVFLKITGEPDALEKFEPAVEAMARSVELGGPEQVTFDVPEGWQRAAGGGFTAARVAPPDMQGVDGPLTVTILSRPADEAGWQANLQSNLDRWRGQLNLPPVPVDQESDENVRKISAENTELPIYLVDYVGTGSGAMRPPFMGGMSSAPPAADLAEAGEKADEIAAEVAAEVPDVSVAQAPQEARAAVEYDLPEEWVAEKVDPQSIRLASIKTSTGPEAADVSFVLAGGEDASIVELWAAAVFGEVQPTREQIDAILADAEPVTAANGVSGKLYYISAPTVEPKEALGDSPTHTNDPTILGVIFEAPQPPAVAEATGDDEPAAGSRRGFVKMTGPRGEVEANRAKFRTFVESLRW